MSDAEPTEPTPNDPKQTTASPLAEARLAAVVARANQPLDEEQRAGLRTICERHVELAHKLHATPLGNADEPEIVFVPFRGADGP